MQDLKITLVQTSLFWGDHLRNLEMLTRKLADVAETDLIVLPEMFSTGFITEPETVAENMNGPSMQWLREMSDMKKAVITGSLIIRENGRYFNRLVWMRPDGSYETYDKRHLFRMAGEHDRFTMGTSRKIMEVKGWRVFTLICYDLRFPVWAQNRLIGGKHEYDILLVTANWPEVRNQAWKLMLAARAIDNQAYAVGVNRVGNDGRGMAHSGDTAVIDPRGKPITQIIPGEESVTTLILNHKDLADFREAFQVGLDWDDFSISGS
jgi:predicted amidohydrolase